MKATPVWTISKVELSLTMTEVERALADPSTLTGILRKVVEHVRTAPEMDEDELEPAAIRTTQTKRKPTAPHTYVCNECDRSFTSERRLANHVRKEHEGDTSADD